MAKSKQSRASRIARLKEQAERGYFLPVRAQGGGYYIVASASGLDRHFVDCRDDMLPVCDHPGRAVCEHVLAVGYHARYGQPVGCGHCRWCEQDRRCPHAALRGDV